MKPLSEVTKEDAIEIIKAGDPDLFKKRERDNWIFHPVKHSKFKILRPIWSNDMFQFTAEGIKEMNLFDIGWHDIAIPCLIKAYELGYNVPELGDFVSKLSHVKICGCGMELQPNYYCSICDNDE